MPHQHKLMFNFDRLRSLFGRTDFSEAEILQACNDTRNGRNSFADEMLLVACAERMIELAKAPQPKPASFKINTSLPLREQLAGLLQEAGLNPDRFLLPRPENSSFNYGLETKPMCQPGSNSKQIADEASRELAQFMKDDLGVTIPPILLRLWLVERWDQVAKLAHKIHGSG